MPWRVEKTVVNRIDIVEIYHYLDIINALRACRGQLADLLKKQDILLLIVGISDKIILTER